MFDNLEELYSNIPPTKLRNQEEKFKPAKTSAFWMWVADRFFYGMIENRFFAFRYKGIENFENLYAMLKKNNESGYNRYNGWVGKSNPCRIG